MWVVIALLLATFTYPVLMYVKSRSREKLPTPEPIRPEVQLIIDLIYMGKDWVMAECTMFHPSGVTVWIVNDNSTIKWNSRDVYDYVGPSEEHHEYYLKGRENTEIKKAISALKSSAYSSINSADVQKTALRISDMYKDTPPQSSMEPYRVH